MRPFTTRPCPHIQPPPLATPGLEHLTTIDMTDYNLIFGAVLLFNIAVTFRASSYYRKYFPSEEDNTSEDVQDDSEEPTPLLGESGEATTNNSNKEGGGGGGDGDVEKGQSKKINSAASDAAATIRHSQLLRKYLVVYLLAALSDWLQGPYVYALYDAYGYSQHDIAVLFVAGFGSSMVFGSFVGGMADQ